MKVEFRTLKADEIECRVGTINEKGFTVLLYKDARCDMNILDETVGNDNWQRDHKEVKGNLYGGVSIWDEIKKQWITKWDCGTESNTEKEKGESSDSFKRACVNWGIGRELYSAPVIRVKGNVNKTDKGKFVPAFWDIAVAEIGYNDRREINKLIIKGDNEVVFTFGQKQQNEGGRYETNAKKTEQKPVKKPVEQAPATAPLGKRIDRTEMVSVWKVQNVEEMIAWLENNLGVKMANWDDEMTADVRAFLEVQRDKKEREAKKMQEALKNTDGELPFER